MMVQGTLSWQLLVLLALSSSVSSFLQLPTVRRSCRRDNQEPCSVFMGNSTSVFRDSSLRPCDCYNSAQCSGDYGNSNRAKIFYNIFVPYMQFITLYTMYCENVAAMRECDPSEYSLQLSKLANNKIAIDYYRCRCQGVTSHRANNFTEGRFTYLYKCGEMPSCTANQVRLSLSARGLEGHCRCNRPMISETLHSGNRNPRCLSKMSA